MLAKVWTTTVLKVWPRPKPCELVRKVSTPQLHRLRSPQQLELDVISIFSEGPSPQLCALNLQGIVHHNEPKPNGSPEQAILLRR
jgi:hypothetical protein